MVLMFSAAMGDTTQQWVYAHLPTGLEKARTHYTHAIQPFSQVTTQAASIATHQNEMEEEYNRLQSEWKEAKQEATITTVDLTSLTEQVAEQRATIKSLVLAPRHATSEEHSAHPIPISDPAPYSGTEKDLLPFIDRLHLKLDGARRRFPTTQHQLAYAISRLEGDAFNQVQGKIGKINSDRDCGNIGYASVEELLIALKEAFGDPDTIGTAQRQLAALRQRNHDFSRYLIDLTRLSNLVQMTKSFKIFALRSGLSPRMKEEIHYHDEPEDIKGFVALLKNADVTVRAHQADTTQRPNAPPAPRAPAPPGHASHTPGGVTPMDLSEESKKVSAEEREACLREGRCFYCEGVLHMYSTCPVKRKGGRRVRISEAKLPAPMEEQLAENEESMA